MSKHIPVPDDLKHLIEKRDNEGDRRKTGQRKSDAPSTGDRRKKTDRRRRKKA